MEIDKKEIPGLNLGSSSRIQAEVLKLTKGSENKSPGESASQKPRKWISKKEDINCCLEVK